MNYTDKIQSVTELTRSIRGLLETEFPFVTVKGQITNLKKPYSGHIYCSLRDQEAQIRIVLFKSQQRWLSFTPQEGMEVVCRGRLSVYEPRGEYQIIVDTLERGGAGSLQIAFEELKNRLQREGLFSPARKKPLPFLPEKITLLTSPSGAALYDFLRLALLRFPACHLEIFPVRVQGEGSALDITTALSLLNKRAEESGTASDQVIVLCRGGGSIEDLWTFNDEKLARAIADSAVPVVSAVGHDVDFTIADFVADHRSATPTSAAREVLPNKDTLNSDILKLQKRLATALIHKMRTRRQHLLLLRRRLGDPVSILTHHRLRLDSLQMRLITGIRTLINYKRHRSQSTFIRFEGQKPDLRIARWKMQLGTETERMIIFMRRILDGKTSQLATLSSRLESMNPLAVLERGYAIVRKIPGCGVIDDSTKIEENDRIDIRLHKGSVRGRLIEISRDEET